MHHAIAIDFGGTAIKGAVLSDAGQIQARHQHPTEAAKGADAVLQNIFSVIDTLRAQAPGVTSVGIGAPAPIQSAAGIGTQFPNLPLPDNFPIRDIVQKHIGLPVVVHNDANAAMIGEAWMGAAKDASSAVMFTLGTGIGGGVIINGKLFDGGFGLGAELGHIRVSLEGPSCGLGVPGCFEMLASAQAVVRMGKERISKDITDSKQVYDLAKSGDERAIAIWREIGMWIGIGVGNYINIFNPQYFIIGGNMAAAWELFEPSMMEEARRRSYPALFSLCTITQAQLGNDAGVYGAARAAFDAVALAAAPTLDTMAR